MSDWPPDLLKIHIDTMRAADQRYESALRQADQHFESALREADQRALEIKEKADDKALDLASEIQKYKDEKANELRSQIERERGSYATQSDLKGMVEKLEAVIKPLDTFVSAQQGKSEGITRTTATLFSILAAIGVLSALYYGSHKSGPAPIVVNVPAATTTTTGP